MRGALLILASSLLVASQAAAQTREAQFSVRATVVADCQVNVTDLNFGTYDQSAAKTGQTTINLQCTPGSAATISLSAGNSGNPSSRYMAGGAGNLNYQLYRDAALQDPINTAGMAFQLSGLANTGQVVPYNVYGQIPSGQLVAAGNYTDTIRVTVQF